jgi:hypothetical protein
LGERLVPGLLESAVSEEGTRRPEAAPSGTAGEGEPA